MIPEFHDPNAGRLGRHVEHDPQSRAFRVARAPAIAAVSWHRRVPAYDQGTLGSCTGNAMAGVLSTAPFTHRYTESRAVKLYEQATALDGMPGTYPPDDTGSSGLAVAKAAKADGLIGSYLHAFGLTDLQHALQSGAALAGVNWYDSFDAPDSAGHVRLTPGAVVRGGHEFEIAGMDPDTQLFQCWQSWGPAWGDGHGRFYVPFADMDRLLAAQGDVTVPQR